MLFFFHIKNTRISSVEQSWQKMFDTVEAVLDFYGVARTLIQRVLQHLYREDMLTIPQPSQNVPDKHQVSTLHS